MNKWITIDTSAATRHLLRHGGEYRKGYIEALKKLDVIRVCTRCGRLFYPGQGHRTVCGRPRCVEQMSREQEWHTNQKRSVKFSTIVARLQARAERGDKDGERMLRNFLNSYALCDTPKEREDLIYLWVSEYPSLIKGKPGKGVPRNR